jgi:hypothetical protein
MRQSPRRGLRLALRELGEDLRLKQRDCGVEVQTAPPQVRIYAKARVVRQLELNTSTPCVDGPQHVLHQGGFVSGYAGLLALRGRYAIETPAEFVKRL